MRKIFLAVLFVAMFPFYGNSQTAQRWYTALLPNPQGEDYVAVIPNASVYVCEYNIDAQCVTSIGIYADKDLTQPIVQPLLADGNGVYSYYIQSGTQVVEKVCAPYNQCASYIVMIGDNVATGPGSGTVTSLSCGNLSPLFACSVTNPTTTPDIGFTLDTAQSFGFLGNVAATTGLPSYTTLVAGTNITLTANTGVTPNTLTISAAGGGGGGCTGTLPGDTTSTDCGANNRVGDTAPIPADIQTFGYTNLGSNSGDFGVAVGNNNGVSSHIPNTVYIGNSNAQYVQTTGSDQDAVIIGDSNAVGTSLQPCKLWATVLIGNHNDNPCVNRLVNGVRFQDTVGIGDTNYLFNNHSPANVMIGSDVAIGQQNFYDSAGQTGALSIGNSIGIGGFNLNSLNGNSSELVAIGDSGIYGSSVGGSTLQDFVVIGDVNAGAIIDGSHDWVAIGDNNAQTVYSSTANYNIVAIGFSNGNIWGGHDVVAIGDTAVNGSFTAGNFGSTGNEIIGIGDTACATNTTGSDNICIGDQAGVPSYNTNVGNSTGSHNIYIGDAAGPTGIQSGFSNDIALGWNASITQSNETVIGNASTTLAIMYGFLEVNAGTNIVYRCATAGTLPAGALTITAANCGTTADTGLRVQ